MWPGQQPPGGEQNPQDPNRNPYAQPGYQQPNPYQQPGYQQQPNPYAQPGPAGQWSGPGAPGGPQPPGDGRNKRVTVIAIAAAVAVVIAAGVTGAVVLTGDDTKDDQQTTEAQDGPKPSASVQAPPSSSPGGGGEDNPRASQEVKPVINGWKVVINPKRHVVFDVPADWSVAQTGTGVIVPDQTGKDKDGMAEAMSSPAYFEEKRCVSTSEKGIELNHEGGIVGAKGAQGAKSLQEAAENAAASWAWAMFDQKKKGKLNIGKASAFKSDHGVTGFTAMTTATDVPKDTKCATDGKGYAVAYKDDTGDLNTWIFAGVKGEKEEVSDDTIKKIMSTLRPLKSS
ncbi:hypothetical protein [Streptomyces sp. NPDC053048]|uniref:hypothetical protein n=1 Tax=Streptomyces sp. NPDC053048 TaxID=3365694 RepID=UPI0037D3D3FA